jgi:O-6-methylguanine DNA methyltransferase
MEQIFKSKVLEVTKGIPKGETLTYKKVAELAGKPKAYRAVGNILSRNYDPLIPCHRVIRTDGKIGGYNRGIVKKAEILRQERLE